MGFLDDLLGFGDEGGGDSGDLDPLFTTPTVAGEITDRLFNTPGQPTRGQLNFLLRNRQKLLSGERATKGFINEAGELVPGIARQLGADADFFAPIIQQGASRGLFDPTAPANFAQREVARSLGPGFLENRAAASPFRTGLDLSFQPVVRDIFTRLASDAEAFNAQQRGQFALQGPGVLASTRAAPAAFLTGAADDLLRAGTNFRVARESTRAGAAPLVPTLLSPLEQLARIETSQQFLAPSPSGGNPAGLGSLLGSSGVFGNFLQGLPGLDSFFGGGNPLGGGTEFQLDATGGPNSLNPLDALGGNAAGIQFVA